MSTALNDPLRVVFMGTPDFAVASLVALHDDPRTDVVLVVSQPDRRAGRGKKLTSPPVAAKAKALGIDVFQPESMREEDAVARVDSANADLCVVAAYGQILRQNVLDLPRLGCVNVHASLLPRWRGAAPIHRAIEAGDAVTGVAIMGMERGLDTGPVYRMHAVMIGETETAGDLHDRLAAIGATLLTDALDDIVDPTFEPTPQPSHRTTYAGMLSAADRALSFDAPAADVAARINGMSPWPSTCANVVVDGETLKVTFLRAKVSAESPNQAAPGTIVIANDKQGLHVACAEGAVEVLEMKRPGKRGMSTRDMLRGFSLPIGAPLQPVDG